MAASVPASRRPRWHSTAPSRARLRCFVLSAALACASCGGEPATTLLSGRALGTSWSVQLAGELDPADGARANEIVQAELDLVDRLMSTYRQDSELSRLNRHAANEPFPVSPETLAVLLASRETGEASGGAFDVTVGPLVDAWGFGPSGPTQTPAAREIVRLRADSGWDKIKIDAAKATVTKASADVRCDLSGSAKGYAVDRVAEALAQAGWMNHMVEIGGEIRVRGRNAEGALWRIGIEKPSSGKRAVQRAVTLDDQAMATSGDYRNYYERDGRRYSHTIDPRTGRPVRHRLASVSVVAEDCLHADARATALMALGEDEGYRAAVEQGWAALLLIRVDGSERIEERATPAFGALFAVGGS